MKLSVTFPELVSLREGIGAPLSNWTPGTASLSPREQFLAELEDGVEINLEDVDAGPGRLLTYQGEQVLLYIKDTGTDLETLLNEPEKSKRFHIAECRTLERMRREGRFERYVVTNRMDGTFLVDWLDPVTRERSETEANLKVCKNCLSALNWRGYDNRRDRLQLPGGRRQVKDEIWESFAISEFLMEYSTFFRTRPKRRDDTAKLNVYVDDWPQISEQMRHEANWRCEKCGVDLSTSPGLLHCHHKNGVVTDNDRVNLAVLCALDHAAQPGHQHMRISPESRRIIQTARIQQGIAAI